MFMFRRSRARVAILAVIILIFGIAGYNLIKQSHALSADVNGDGVVNLLDLTVLASNYGKTGMTFSQGDLNGDSAVNISDLSVLASDWGTGASSSGNVVACGPQLCLNGQPYHFVGFNIYQANSKSNCSYTLASTTPGQTSALLDKSLATI